MEQYRQGDVFIIKVGEMPEDSALVERDKGRVILAYGEVTGHVHALVEPDVELFSSNTTEDRFLKIMSSATLTHEEHAAITLAPGIYQIRQQKEYTPAEIVRVAD